MDNDTINAICNAIDDFCADEDNMDPEFHADVYHQVVAYCEMDLYALDSTPFERAQANAIWEEASIAFREGDAKRLQQILDQLQD